MEFKILKKKKYKILKRVKGLEIRQYFPSKRTIIIANRQYFLPFPYIIFAKAARGRNDYRGKFINYNHLLVAFSNRELYRDEDATVFHPALPNVEGRNKSICLDGGGHYEQSPNLSFNDLLDKFWSFSFNSIKAWVESDAALHVFFGGRFATWAKLTIEEVLSNLDENNVKDYYLKDNLVFPFSKLK